MGPRGILFVVAAVMLALSPLYDILWPVGWAVAVLAYAWPSIRAHE